MKKNHYSKILKWKLKKYHLISVLESCPFKYICHWPLDEILKKSKVIEVSNSAHPLVFSTFESSL